MKEPLLIIGIGASAGGLEAFLQLLKSLPDNTGMAFVFIQHLEPKHESKLSQILSSVTSIPVKQVKHGMEVNADNVYVIPPVKYLSIESKKLLLSERKKSEGLYLPIDHFFQSLAKEKKDKAIGIILSGTASDGTVGLKAIKAEGGLTFAQDEESAKYTGMPANAVNSGNVDIILPPDKIAKELTRIAHHPYILGAQPHRKDVFNLIIFKEKIHLPEPSLKKKKGKGTEPAKADTNDNRYKKLKEELLITIEHLQSGRRGIYFTGY